MPSPVEGVPHVVESCQRRLRSYSPDFHFASRLRTNIPPVASADDILGISFRCSSPECHPGANGARNFHFAFCFNQILLGAEFISGRTFFHEDRRRKGGRPRRLRLQLTKPAIPA